VTTFAIEPPIGGERTSRHFKRREQFNAQIPWCIPFMSQFKMGLPARIFFEFAGNHSHLCHSYVQAKTEQHGGPPDTAGKRGLAIPLHYRPFIFCAYSWNCFLIAMEA
jgi:hypothetical protein